MDWYSSSYDTDDDDTDYDDSDDDDTDDDGTDDYTGDDDTDDDDDDDTGAGTNDYTDNDGADTDDDDTDDDDDDDDTDDDTDNYSFYLLLIIGFSQPGSRQTSEWYTGPTERQRTNPFILLDNVVPSRFALGFNKAISFLYRHDFGDNVIHSSKMIVLIVIVIATAIVVM